MIFKKGYLYIRSNGRKVIIMQCFEGRITEYFSISVYRSCIKLSQLNKKDRHSYFVTFEKEVEYLNVLLSQAIKEIDTLRAVGGER